MPNNRFTLEVEETGSQRTKAEIVSLLDQTTAKASEASRALTQLKADSIKHSEAVSGQASAVRQLGIVRSREIQSIKDLQQASTPYVDGLKQAINTQNTFQKLLSSTTKEREKLQKTTNADANRLSQLKVQEKNYQGVVRAAKDEVVKYKDAIAKLTEQKSAHVQNARILNSQLVTERAALSSATDAQASHNREKQKAQIAYNQVEGQVKKLNKELKNLEAGERAAERESRRMDEASLALANTVGYALYNAIRGVISQIKEFISNAVIYASRTEEMRLAMLNMSKQSGVSRGELLLQAEAMQNMNITTQETYETLTKFQLAQLDVTKATDLARVAQDLAVVAGVETGEEVNRLVHGITTLQIRVLRTAGVFVSLEQSMKEAALAQGRSTESFSEGEKQQILLNKVLEVGARATGNYETALDNAGKRMRSMTRIFQDMQNAVGGLLQGPFGNLVDILSGLMKLVSAAPKVFAGLTLVLVGLGVQILRNMSFTSGWIKWIVALIAELRQATAAALGLTTALSGQTAAATTATSRFTSFGRALSTVAVMSGKLLLITAALNVVLEAGAQISKATGGTTKINTEDLKNQTVAIEELRMAQERLNALRLIQSERIKEGYSDKYGRAVGFFGRLEEVVGSGLSVVGLDQWVKTSSVLNKQIQDEQDNVDILTTKLEEQGDKIASITTLQREYDEQISKSGKINLDFSGTTGIVGLRLTRLKTQFEELNKVIDVETGQTFSYAEKLNILKPGILDLDNTLQKIAGSQENYNRLVQEADERFPGFIEALKALRSESDKYIEGVGEAAGEAARRIIDVQRRLRSAIREIYGLFGQGDQQEIRVGQLELLEKRLQIVRQEIDSINDLRINLNRDVGQPIPQDREQRVSLQAVYETAVKVRDEIRAAQRANRDFVADVVKAQQIASSARTTAVKTELIAAKLIAENQLKRVQDERQMTAEVVALTKQRADAAKDEVGTQRQAYARFYKEQLENLVSAEDETRRLRAELSFISGEKLPGVTVPEFGLGGITTALENIALPAATQAENVATITQSVQHIETLIEKTPVTTGGTSTTLGDLMGATFADPKFGPRRDSPEAFKMFFESAARKYSLDLPFLTGIARQESSFNPYATSSKGAQGVMQLMPGTAKQYGVTNPYDPQQSIMGGAAYLHYLMNIFGGNKVLVAAAYNAGEGAVKKFGGVPPYAETKQYVANILGSNYDLNTRIISPKLPKGAEGTAFPITRRTSIENLTPGQLIGASRLNTVIQRRLSKQIQESYTGSAQANLDYYGAAAATSKSETEDFKKTQTEIRIINERTAQGFYDSEEKKRQVFSTTELSRKRAAIATHDTILQLDEDERTHYRESAEYEIKINEEAQIKIREAFNTSKDNLAAIQADQRARTQYHEEYITTIHNNAEAARTKSSQNAEDRYNEMLEEINSGWRKSLEFRLQQYRNFEVERYEETKRTEDSIDELKYQISHATDLDPLRIEEARLRAVLEVSQADGQAKAEMEANAVRLADAQIFHANRSNAKVMEYFAEQRSIDQIVADAKINTLEKIFGAVDTALGRITAKLGAFGDIVKEIISGLARIALSKVFMSVFGLSPTTQPQANQGNFGTNIFNSIFGSLGSFHSIGTGVQNGPGGTPPFVPSNLSSLLGGITNGQQSSQQSLSQIFRNVTLGGTGSSNISIPDLVSRVGVGASIQNGINIGGNVGIHEIGHAASSAAGAAAARASFASSIAASLPLLGLGIGAGLGGQSRTGGVLGGAGGLLAGGIGAAFLAPGLFATTGILGSLGPAVAGLLTNPFTAIAAGGLILGAVLLGKNAKKRANEKKREAFTTDALSKLNSLLSQVRRDNIGGEEALAQAAGIRQQYMEASNALNDSKTRNIALKDVSRLDLIISQIKAASKAQERRRELDEQLVPEFAMGGRVLPVSSGRGGVVPGTDLGYDNVLALLRPNEVVLNKRQQNALGGSHVFAAAGVPGFIKNTAITARQYVNGGYSSSPFTPESSYRTSGSKEINVFVVTDKKYAEQMAEQGRDKIVSLTANNIRDKGKIYSAAKKI